MSDIKRRDNKGRILQNGESQDASGRYAYRYVDAMGRRKAIYSWRLTQSDTVPSGKKYDILLREKEKQIQKELLQGINAEDMTVCELVDRYLATATSVHFSEKPDFSRENGTSYFVLHTIYTN